MNFVLSAVLAYQERDAYTDGVNQTIYNSAVNAARKRVQGSERNIPYYLEVLRQFVWRKEEPLTGIQWCCKTTSQAKGLLADLTRQTCEIVRCFNVTTEEGIHEAARVNRLALDLLETTRALTEAVDAGEREFTSKKTHKLLYAAVKAYHELEGEALATADRLQELVMGSNDAAQAARVDDIIDRHLRMLSCF